DQDVGDHAGAQQAAVVQAEDRGGFEGQPPHRLFERHDSLLAYPLRQEAGREAIAALELDMRAAIRQADYGIRIGQDLGDRRIIDIVLAMQELGVEVLLDREIEERVDYALVLRLGDLADGVDFDTL